MTLQENVESCKECENLTLKVICLNEEVSDLQQKSLSLSKPNNDLGDLQNNQDVFQNKESLEETNTRETTHKSLTQTIVLENTKIKQQEPDALVDASTRQGSEEKSKFNQKNY